MPPANSRPSDLSDGESMLWWLGSCASDGITTLGPIAPTADAGFCRLTVLSAPYSSRLRLSVDGIIPLSIDCGVICSTPLDLLLSELAMPATLSFLIIDEAEVRIIFSDRDRITMPGNGSTLRDHTSLTKLSSLVRSAFAGVNTVICEGVSKDFDR